MSLAGLIPDSDYRFQMRFERGSIADFFLPSPQHDDLVRERRRWLQEAPDTYAALLPEGIPLADEAAELAKELNGAATLDQGLARLTPDPWRQFLDLGGSWEPDFLLLKAGADSEVRLWAGCVCFPSSWSLAEKMGRPIENIHGVVPGLNQQIGGQIRAFLTHLKPGVAWQRTNWGLSRSAERNQHPARALPGLDHTVTPEQVWLRVEHQALVALPRTGGILFGIRIASHPLIEILSDSTVRPQLRRALETMPEAVANYKGLSTARTSLLRLLSS